MSEEDPKIQDKNAKEKVSNFFMQAPTSIRKTMNENNSTFWTKLEEKAKQKKENGQQEVSKEKIQDDKENQKPPSTEDIKLQPISEEKDQKKDLNQNQNGDHQKQDLRKIDQVKNFFTQSTTAAVSQKASNSYDQMLTSIRKKQEEHKQKQQQKEQINSDVLKAAEGLQKDIEQKNTEKENSNKNKTEQQPSPKEDLVQQNYKQPDGETTNKSNEQNQKESSKESQSNIQSQSELKVVSSEPKKRQVEKLAYFFTNSTSAVSMQASQKYQNFKDKIKEKQQKKHEDSEIDRSFQQMVKEEESGEKKKERSDSYEKSKLVSKILPHNHHYQEEIMKEQRKQSNQNDSFENDQYKEDSKYENYSVRKGSQKNEKIGRNHSKSPVSQKYTLKRKISEQNQKNQKQNQNHNESNQQQGHVYVRQFVEKEFDKEEKLREAARKKRELELQLLQVNQELIHLRKDLGNEDRSPQSNQVIIKKGKIIPPIKEHNQVKAMIQISDDKKALEDAMSLVRRMQQERKLKEQQSQQRMKQHQEKFQNKIQQFKDDDQEYFQQKELQKKNAVLTRMQEYELKKIEGIKLQNASKQFIKELTNQGPKDGKISEHYKSNIYEIQKEIDSNISQVRYSKIQTPLLEQKKQNLQNARNIEEYRKTDGDEDFNDRQAYDEQQYNNLEEGSKYESYQRSTGKRSDSTQIKYNNSMQSSLPLQKGKKDYGSIFTKRVIAHDQQIKQQDRILSEEKKQLYEKRVNYAKIVKQKYTPKIIVDNYNFYQDAIFLKQKMKVSDQMNKDYYRPEQQQPLRASQPSDEYRKYSQEPNNYIEANRAWKVHNKIILNHEYPQSEQIKKLQY